MNKKRVSAAALALAMTASMSISALASENNGAVDGTRLPEDPNENGIALINAENGNSGRQPVAGLEGFVVNDGVETEVDGEGTLVITPDGTPVDNDTTLDDLDSTFSVDAEVIPEFYNGVVTLNGEDITSVDYATTKDGDWQTYHNYVEIAKLPGAPAGYIPMRLLVQATEEGFASYYKEDKLSLFFFNGVRIYTDFNTGRVYILDDDFNEVDQDCTYYLSEGITYLPADFIDSLDGVFVDYYTFDGQEIFDIYIEEPGSPLDQLAAEIISTANMPSGDTGAASWFSALAEVEYETYFEEVAGMIPMMNVQSDVLVIGKYTEGVDKAEAQACLQKFLDWQLGNFESYLPEQYEKAKKGQIVESENGEYVMVIISGDNATAIETFQAGIAAGLDAETGIQPR